MDKITLKEILSPIDINTFFKEYWGKKHLVIRRNKFNNLYTFKDLNNYLNRVPDVKSLQILNYDNKNTRWCLDKVHNGKLKLPMLKRSDIFHIWNNVGKSFVLPFSEYQKKDLVDILFQFERYFGHGQANVYASPKKGSKSFPAHADSTENFLFHTEGQVKWTIYKEFSPGKPKEILEEFILEAGDLLYIPQYQYHKVDTIGPRILISVHFQNKPKQSLDNFKITSVDQSNRDKWYNWKPKLYDNKGKKVTQWKMQSDTWKKKYFRDKI